MGAPTWSKTIESMGNDPDPEGWNDPVNRAIACMVRELYLAGVDPALLGRAAKRGYGLGCDPD